MATDLRANDTIQVRVPQGGGSVRDVPLSELNEYISTEEAAGITALETYVGDYSTPKGTDIATDLAKIWEDVYPKPEPDGTSISERMDALDDTETGVVPVLMERADAVDQQLFETQGMADKLAAIELRKDSIVEILENKNIVNPQINEIPVRAYFDIALTAPATKKIRISAITPGVAANSYTYLMAASKNQDDVAIFWSAPDIGLMLLKDDDERIITTAYELARLAAVTPDFVSNFIISFDDGTPITEDGDGAGVIAAADSGSFANGAGADHVLTSTGTQIDTVVAIAPASGAPITAQVSATAITAEGENEEITWTAVANGEDGNGIAIDIKLSAEATDIDIMVGGNAINVDVKTGEGTTATDVLTAVNAHATAGLLVQGALTGPGGAITADSVETSGGKDITAGLAGAIRYEADKIWISTDESTASVSNWAYALLTDPNV
jgi:hypothetical protein